MNLMSFQSPKMFLSTQTKQNNCLKFCYKLSPQCNKTVDYCPWPEIEQVGNGLKLEEMLG